MSYAEAEELDPYDNPLIMPLQDFVAHPTVQDLLGDGAAMQVLSAALPGGLGGEGERGVCAMCRSHLRTAANADVTV